MPKDPTPTNPKEQKKTPGRSKEFDAQLVLLTEKLIPIALRLTNNNHHDAQDLVQDVLLKAMDKFPLFREGTNLHGWLTTILKNTRFSDLRLISSRRTVRGEAADIAILNQSTLGNAEHSLTLSQVTDKINELTPKMKEVLLLTAVFGYTPEEASEITGMNESTIKTSIARARAKLRDFSEF